MTTTKVMNCCPTFLEYPLVHSCTCHTKPQHEGWNKSFQDHEWYDMYHGVCEQLKLEYSPNIMYSLGNKVEEYIRTHIEAAQEDMRRRCLEAIDELDESYLIQKVSGNDPVDVRVSFASRQACIKSVRMILKAITPTKD